MSEVDWNVMWVCQWDGECSSIHDTPEDAQDYGNDRGDDKPFHVFPIRLQRWVPAMEALPPAGVKVLARAITGEHLQCDWCMTVGWRLQDGTCASRNYVTHWMPLPEPPPQKFYRIRMTNNSEVMTMNDKKNVAAHSEHNRTLTDDERLAIEWAAVSAREQSQVAIHKTLRRLLARGSSPQDCERETDDRD